MSKVHHGLSGDPCATAQLSHPLMPGLSGNSTWQFHYTGLHNFIYTTSHSRWLLQRKMTLGRKSCSNVLCSYYHIYLLMTVCVRTLPVAKIIHSPMKERLVKSQLERIQNETDMEYNEGICLEVLWKTQSRLPVSGPNFKAGTSRIQRRATNHSTA
jgi:hypothetical protein